MMAAAAILKIEKSPYLAAVQAILTKFGTRMYTSTCGRSGGRHYGGPVVLRRLVYKIDLFSAVCSRH